MWRHTNATQCWIVSWCKYTSSFLRGIFFFDRIRKRAKKEFSDQKFEQTVKAAAASRWACPPASSLPGRRGWSVTRREVKHHLNDPNKQKLGRFEYCLPAYIILGNCVLPSLSCVHVSHPCTNAVIREDRSAGNSFFQVWCLCYLFILWNLPPSFSLCGRWIRQLVRK